MVTIFFTIFNIIFELIRNFIYPFHYNKFENKNLVNSFNKLPDVVFNEWKKYKLINKIIPKNNDMDVNNNIYIENNINKYLEPDQNNKNTYSYLHINMKLNDHIEELDENLVKYCIDILSYSKLNNLKHVYIFTDGSSVKKGYTNNGGSGLITIHPNKNKIDCYALRCRNCDSLSSEYNPFIFLINNWFEIIPNDINKVIIFCDNKGVVDNLNHIFNILHHNFLYYNINICSKYSFKNMHERWCKILISSFNKYSINEKHMIISKLQLFWIKAHVMFLWNILADVISKWSRLHLI